MTRLQEIEKEIAELEAEGPARYNDYGEWDPISGEARSVTLAALEGERRGIVEASE